MSSKKTTIFAATYLGVASVWLGGHFGPGFATGAFSAQYYEKYGWTGVFHKTVLARNSEKASVCRIGQY